MKFLLILWWSLGWNQRRRESSFPPSISELEREKLNWYGVLSCNWCIKIVWSCTCTCTCVLLYVILSTEGKCFSRGPIGSLQTRVKVYIASGLPPRLKGCPQLAHYAPGASQSVQREIPAVSLPHAKLTRLPKVGGAREIQWSDGPAAYEGLHLW